MRLFYGGPLDGVATRVMDVLLAFPGILLAPAIVGVLAPGLGSVMIAGSLREVWWISTFPGLAIMLIVVAMNLCGDGLLHVLDPPLKT